MANLSSDELAIMAVTATVTAASATTATASPLAQANVGRRTRSLWKLGTRLSNSFERPHEEGQRSCSFTHRGTLDSIWLEKPHDEGNISSVKHSLTSRSQKGRQWTCSGDRLCLPLEVYIGSAYCVSLCTIGLLVAALAMLFQHMGSMSSHDAWCPSPLRQNDELHPSLYITALFLMLVQSPWTVMLLRDAVSLYLRALALCATLAWISVWAQAICFLLNCNGMYDAMVAANGVGSIVVYVNLLLLPLIVYQHLYTLKKYMHQSSRSLTILRYLLFAGLFLMIPAVASLVLDSDRVLVGVVRWVFLLLWTCFFVTAVAMLLKTQALAGTMAALSQGRRRQQALRTQREVRIQAVGTVIVWAAIVQYQLITGFKNGYLWPAPEMSFPEELAGPSWASFFLVGFLNTLGFFGLAGGFSQSLRRRVLAFKAELARQRIRLHAMEEYRPSADKEWHSKVLDLAYRGITLEALLKFYKGLGSEYMSHFNGTLHKTKDVVRQAIIPLSSATKGAYASIMMNGVPTRPDKMVTHNWENLFRDLVASIVADALQKDEYELIAWQLDNDMATLWEMLAADKKLDMRYWVCAFSVSQHDGICGGNPDNEVDTVTGELHPVCKCGKEKYFNRTPPVNEEGQSIHCEMNKFDDMVTFLACTDSDFAHLIAVDTKFDIFGRAWCVAEIAAAHAIGVEQKIVIKSEEALKARKDSVQRIRVQEMKASREEDVKEILDKIPDKDAFNEALHRLIFATLMDKWLGLDALEQMEAMGRLLRPDDTPRAASTEDLGHELQDQLAISDKIKANIIGSLIRDLKLPEHCSGQRENVIMTI